MNNNDFTFYFIMMSLLNMSIGLSNVSKNEYQEEVQKKIMEKLDRILELLGDSNE